MMDLFTQLNLAAKSSHRVVEKKGFAVGPRPSTIAAFSAVMSGKGEMATTAIHQQLGGYSGVEATWMALRRLERHGYVTQAGKTKGKGVKPCFTWVWNDEVRNG